MKVNISDNIKYADDKNLLGLIVLGKYNGSGQLISSGNIYFGNPRFGTMYTVSALMIAAGSFLYNTDSVTGRSEEPETGFSVYGNLNALNHISIERDWYDHGTNWYNKEARSSYFDPTTYQWVNAENENDIFISENGVVKFTFNNNMHRFI